MAYLWALGKLTPSLVSDSPSYLEFPFDSLTSIFCDIRTPGYPLFLRVINSTVGLGVVPFVQLILHVAACSLLGVALRRLNVRPSAALLIMVTTLLSHSIADNVHLISTDAAAASLGIAAVAILILYVSANDWRLLGLCSLCVFMTVMLRPSYLFLLGFVPLCDAALRRAILPSEASMSLKDGLKRFIITTMIVACPVFVYCLSRFTAVGHFHVVAFGSQNLAGVTLQLLDEPTLAELPESVRPLATKLLAERELWFAENPALAEGMNYQAMEDRWDPLVYEVVVPVTAEELQPGAIVHHRSLSDFNRGVISQQMSRYIFWVAKCVRQALRILVAHIVMHPPYLLAIALAALYMLCKSAGLVGQTLSESTSTHAPADDSQAVIAVVATLYFALGAIPIVLTSPPLGRFVDAIGIFMPALFSVVILTFIGSIRRPLQGSDP